MKNSLLISFDFHRDNESTTSFAIANLLASIKSNLGDNKYLANHYSFNMNDSDTINTNQFANLIAKYDITNYDIIAISLYCWCKQYVNELINNLKSINSKVIIVLGGYEVNIINEKELIYNYPKCDKFIAGYAEESLLSIIKGEYIENKLIHKKIDIKNIPMLYYTKFIEINKDEKIRIESKRGCVYRCSYCAHRDVIDNQLLEHKLEDVIEELKYLNSKDIEKVNFIDPIFNVGSNYLKILESMVDMKFKHLVSFQVRVELIKGKEGKRFIKLLSKLDSIVEFGLQTTNKQESEIINRTNDLSHVKKILLLLNKKSMRYLVSLIYGLPNQTYESFKKNIVFLKENKCQEIECYPLMLLAGTKLFYEKDKYGLVEETHNGLDYVVSSNTFSKKDYLKMKKLAATI